MRHWAKAFYLALVIVILLAFLYAMAVGMLFPIRAFVRGES